LRKNIKPSTKQFIVQGLIKALNGLQLFVKSFFVYFNKYLLSPLIKVFSFLNRTIILNIYRLLIALTKGLRPIIEPVRTKYLIPFLNRYVTHLIIIILTAVIVFLNYRVEETRAENFGENSILYELVRGSDLQDVITTPTETSGTTTEGQLNEPAGQDIDTDLAITQGGAVISRNVTSIEAAKKTRDKPLDYQVKQGDTISGIAANFGLKTDTILWANSMTGRSYLQPGQNLTIPPVDGVLYTIKSGDTISRLAQRYDTEASKIISFNKLADASDIAIGDTILLPDATPYTPPAPIVKTKVAPVTALFTGRQPDAAQEAASSGDSLVWPTTTRRISQYYSWRHTGLDIDGEFGDLIWAAGDGVVSRVQYLKYDYGYNVIIDHGGGVQTLYAHFQKIYVKPGQQVKKGEVLGEMGSTGRSTGSHLHFEIRINSSRINPLSRIKR